MQYALLIYADEDKEPKPNTPEWEAFFNGYNAFTETIQKAGQMKGGNALQPVATATTVKVRDGKTLTTDGPFAETKEQLGGLYVVDCKDLDEAIQIAAKIPSAEIGSIEVRPIMHY